MNGHLHVLLRLMRVKAGWPTPRERQGYGVLIVVGERESRLHGEGGQGEQHAEQGSTRDAKR